MADTLRGAAVDCSARVLLIINVKLLLTFKHTGNEASLSLGRIFGASHRVDSADASRLQRPSREAHQQGATLNHELN